MKIRIEILWIIASAFLFTLQTTASAQVNSWTNAAGGNWEDPYWSLGTLPTTNESIFITNDGIKRLTIGSNTAQNFPGTLNVDEIMISAPSNSFNMLVLNKAGFETPLHVYGLTVGSNSAMQMIASSLLYSELQIDGDFAANCSTIQGGQFILGPSLPARFSLTKSLLGAEIEYLGTAQYYAAGVGSEIFNQHGGTNITQELVLQNSSQYNFFDGTLESSPGAPVSVVFEGNDAQFNQFGGNLSASLLYWNGDCNYTLAGGNLSCSNLNIPNNSYGNFCIASFSQSGGTNLDGQILLGTLGGPGTYSLSGGVLVSSNLILKDFAFGVNPGEEPWVAVFSQSGGFYTNSGIQITGGADEDYNIRPSIYALSNGILATPSINLNMAVVTQSGGTNLAGTVFLQNIASYSLSGGWLAARNVTIFGNYSPYPFGYPGGPLTTFQQSGGTNRIAGTLLLTNFSSYVLSGGQLIASGISLTYSMFDHNGGAATVTGSITLAGATWNEQTAGAQFGQLLLSAYQNSNSTLNLPYHGCTLTFADSSGLAWSNQTFLNIDDWSGSLYGGGSQRIVFGSNSAALTPQQVSQIQFQNPAGLAPGTYPARILATGEIVPDTGAPLPLKLQIAGSLSNGVMPLQLQGDIGQNYAIEVSTDLMNWTLWTNQSNCNGTVSITDCDTTNFPQRFYRVRLVP